MSKKERVTEKSTTVETREDLRDFYNSEIRVHEKMPQFDDLDQCDKGVLSRTLSFSLFKLSKALAEIRKLLYEYISNIYKK